MAKLGPFLGLNNRLPDHQLAVTARGQKIGDYLRNAVNVDITAAGTVQRRPGVAEAQACTDAHSLWSEGTAMYYVDGGTLYQYPRTAVRTGLTPDLRTSYALLPTGDVVWSNGAVLERIRDGVSVSLGVPVPNPAPDVTATSGGALPAGVYQVAITAVSSAGEESGSTWPMQLEVPADGKIVIAGLPGTLVNIYLSPANGDLLFLTVSTWSTSYTIPVLGRQGAQLMTRGLREMPPGQIVRWYNGRLLIATGSMLAYSEPYAPALHNPLRGYIVFPERVVVVEPVEGGVFVATTQATYWVAGSDIDKAQMSMVLPYGGVEGTGSRIASSREVWWFSERGAVLGSPGGSVKAIQDETVAVETAAAGATLYREQNGLRQLVTSLFGTEANVAAATSFMTAEVVRKESML